MTEIEDLRVQLAQTKLAYLDALQNNHLKTAFLSRIAHEIRSPLSTMIGLHQLVIHDLCDNRLEEKESIIQANQYAKKLVSIIDRSIEVSKLEIGKINLEITSFNLVEFLEDIYSIISLEAENKNIYLEVKNRVDNVIIKTDKVRLTNLIFYLLEVVIDFSEIGRIKIDLSEDKDRELYLLKINFSSSDFSLRAKTEPIELSSLSTDELKRLQTLPQFSNQMKISLAETLLKMLRGNLEFKESNTDKIMSKELRLSLPFVTVV